MVSKVDKEFSDFVHVIEHYVCSICTPVIEIKIRELLSSYDHSLIYCCVHLYNYAQPIMNYIKFDLQMMSRYRRFLRDSRKLRSCQGKAI